MTPIEKAEELINKMYYTQSSPTSWNQAQQCALIAVNEILNAIDWDYYEGSSQTEHNYWKEVKQEIEKL